MGNGRQIWGEGVQRTTGAPVLNPNPDDNGNANNGGAADETTEEPMVLLSDGSRVPVEEYDPYKTERDKVDADRARVDGMLEAAKVTSTGNGDPNPDESSDGGSDDPPHPLLRVLEENPLLEEVDIDNTEFASDFERDLAIKNNGIIQYAKQQNQLLVDRETAFTKRLDEVSESVADRFVREDIARIEATTGVTQEEIVAANKQTGISDVDTLATLVLGAKAHQEKIAEAEAAAQKTREQGTSNITSASRGGGNQGGGGEEPRRGVSDWRDSKEVAAKYHFKPA